MDKTTFFPKDTNHWLLNSKGEKFKLRNGTHLVYKDNWTKKGLKNLPKDKEAEGKSLLIWALANDFDNLEIGYNQASEFVYLFEEEEYTSYMKNPLSEKVEQFFSCPYCGKEGFRGVELVEEINKRQLAINKQVMSYNSFYDNSHIQQAINYKFVEKSTIFAEKYEGYCSLGCKKKG